MTIETILNSDMSVAYITDCATSPVKFTFKRTVRDICVSSNGAFIQLECQQSQKAENYVSSVFAVYYSPEVGERSD